MNALMLATLPAESVVSLRLVEAGKESASKLLDRLSVIVLPIVYLAVSAAVVIKA